MYLAAGNSKNPPALSAFRDVARLEKDPDAAESAEVAAVKLGGDAERKSFLKRIEEAPPEKALAIQDQMLYVGDPKLAKALLTWFDNTAGVMRLGSDRQGGGSVRMCDLAAWIALPARCEIRSPAAIPDEFRARRAGRRQGCLRGASGLSYDAEVAPVRRTAGCLPVAAGTEVAPAAARYRRIHQRAEVAPAQRSAGAIVLSIHSRHLRPDAHGFRQHLGDLEPRRRANHRAGPCEENGDDSNCAASHAGGAGHAGDAAIRAARAPEAPAGAQHPDAGSG